MVSRQDRRQEFYQPRDTGYDTVMAEGTLESLPVRPRRLLSPVPLESLTPAGRDMLTHPAPTRTSPEELQREIDAVQREIDELATSVKRPRYNRRLVGDFCDSGSDGSHVGRHGRKSATSGRPATSANSAGWTPSRQPKEAGGVCAAVTEAVGLSEPKRLPGSRASTGPRPSLESVGRSRLRASPVADRPASTESTQGMVEATDSKLTVTSSMTGTDSGRKSLPTIKLGTYDGSTPLETHLAKLENCSEYYGWTGRDRLCHLKASLDGQAGQVLWQLTADATEVDVVKLLRNRFGNVNQTERFRAELQSRRRKKGESVQSVYNDIRRLLALSFPGHSGELCEVIGRDAFLTALGDQSLRVRVLDQQPATLDDALAIVCRMEAYGNTVASEDLPAADASRHRVRVVNTVQPDEKESKIDSRQLQRLEGELAEQRREIRQLRAESERWKARAEMTTVSAPPPMPPPMPPPRWAQAPITGQPYGWGDYNAGPNNLSPMEETTSAVAPPWAAPSTVANLAPPARSQQRQSYGRDHPPRRRQPLDSDTCRLCGLKGHWQRSCPYRDSSGVIADGNAQATHNSTAQASVTGVSASILGSETYLDIDVKGVKAQCLVDSGCDHSIIPRNRVKEAILSPANMELFAANGTQIPVLGKVRLGFTVNNVLPLYADFLVTDNVDECILGYDWLKRNHCQWLFDKAVLVIAGKPVKLKYRPSRANVRRIYVRETVSVPANSQVNVPVRMPLSSWRTPVSEWVAEAKEFRPGLLMGRTLLPNDDKFAAMQFVNLSDKCYQLNSGLFLGKAEPGYVVGQPGGDMSTTVGDTGISEFDGQAPKTSACEPGIGQGSACDASISEPVSEPISEPIRLNSQAAVGMYAPCDASPSEPISEPMRLSRQSSACTPTPCDVRPGRPIRLGEVAAATYPVQHVPYSSEPTRLGTSPEAALLENQPLFTSGDDRSSELVSAVFPSYVEERFRSSVSSVAEGDRGDLRSGSDLPFPLSSEYAHVIPVISSLPDDLTDDQRCRAVKLLVDNADLFSRHEFDFDRTDLLTHRIHTGDHRPIAQPFRRHPRAYLDLIDQTVDKMLDAGVVEPSASPWSFNVVLVARPGNPVPRVTIDYRALNAITCRDKFPLPRVNDCLDALGGSVYFSTLDLSGSFFQVGLDERDRDKTAFATRKGQFRFTTMPMGACNSPSVFARLMSLALRGLTYLCCLVFIDDTIVMGRSFDEHLANLGAVLQRFRQAHLKLKPTKCKVFQRRVRFLGHIVSADGIEVDPKKIQCIQSWEFPRNVSELRAFCGLCSYYRAFCPGFATVAAPLTEMLRKGVAVEPNESRLKAFDELKQFLSSAPVLAMPTDEGEYYLDVDASLVGCGAILQQVQGGVMRVIEYASRTFNRAERAYCVTRREMAALIFGLRHFRSYLLGRKFVCRVDHMALTYFQKTVEPVGQQARYLDFVAEFDFDLQYRSGSRHTNCDALSRRRPCEVDGGEPCKQCNRRVTGQHVRAVQTRSKRRAENLAAPNLNMQIGEDRPEGAASGADPIGSQRPGQRARDSRRRRPGRLHRVAPSAASRQVEQWSTEFLAERQRADSDIGPAINWVADNTRPRWEEVRPASPALRALWQQYESLVMLDGVLHRIFHYADGTVKFYQLVLPTSLKVDFLELIHADAAGHLKFKKCVDHVQRRAWWYTWRRDLKLFIQCCSKCAAYHRGKTPRQGKLRPMLLGAPAERWVIDLCGPYRPSQGYQYIFTAICPFSKYVIAAPLRNKEAASVARIIVEQIILKWGLMIEVLSDLGPEFQAELSQELFRILGVDKIQSTAYRPQTQGSVERWHQVLHSLMAKVVSETQSDWSQCLSYVTFCYNSTSHSATGFAPHFIMTGQQPRWNIDLLLCDKPYEQRSVPDFTAALLCRLHRVHELVRTHLGRAANQASHWYNKRIKAASFGEGDKVRVFNPRRYRGRTPKWQLCYKDVGTVTRRLNEVTYVITSPAWKTPKIIHVDKLKPVMSFPAAP